MEEDLVVITPQGKLIGTKTTTVLFKTPCYSFCGIPYAKPPVDALRFMPPEPFGKWRGVLNATKERDDCLQFSQFYKIIVGSEDCLYLNVHTLEPPCKTKTLKAVIVLIHPGGNFWGSGSRECLGNPDFIVPQDIVFVTFNYRLHAFGFLNLGIPQCSGNMGLKDQVMALKWVKENISCFGGDPNNVTLAGTSSGACDVHFHTMSSLSKGFFHKVIMQSGYAGNANWSYITPESSYERAILLAEEMGYRGGTSARKLCTFFKSKSAIEITDAVGRLKRHIKTSNPEKYDVCQFLPSVEIESENAFFTASPRELMFTVEPIPMICSIAEKEGLFAFCTKPEELIRSNLEKVIKDALSLHTIDDGTVKYMAQRIRSFYFNDKEINTDMLDDIVNMYTDLWYCEWYEMLNYMATLPAAQPVYVYEFKFCGKFNYQRAGFAKYAPQSLKGACHADDGSYFTYYKAMSDLTRNPTIFKEREIRVIKNLNILLANFAKTGNPNGGTLDEIEWKPHHPNNPSHLKFDEHLTIVNSRINEERYQFWDEIIKIMRNSEKRIANNLNPKM
ncbi:esterase E4-like isoform X2 [Planococcus citri]